MDAKKKRFFGEEQESYLYFGDGGRTLALPEYQRNYIVEDLYTVEYVTQGVGYLQKTGEQEVLAVYPGEVCLIRPQVPVWLWADRHTPCTKLWFHAGGRLMDSLWSLYTLPDILVCAADVRIQFMEICALLEKKEETMENGCRLAALVFDILTRTRGEQLFASERERHSVPHQMRKYIDSHIYEVLTLEGLAVRFGYAKMHLIRLFRAEFSITPMQYILQRRMETAKQLLSGTVMPIGEIAGLLQYASAQHFTAAFRRHTGTTPSAYRAEKNGKACSVSIEKMMDKERDDGI